MTKKTMYYFESEIGCGLHAARGIKSARKQLQYEIGSSNLKLVRKAKEEEVDWVSAMGGYIPSLE